MMETPIETQQEEVKDEVDIQPAAKPAVKKAAQKNNPPKKTASKKNSEKNKLTDEIFDNITKRNKEDGTPFHVLCAEYNVSESSLNYRRAKMKETATSTQKQSTKAKASTKPRESLEQVSTDDTSRIKELEQDCNYLRNEYMDLLLRYNRLLSKK